eukprot:scaffold79_cov259-Pinguiococcus_pyrenoidosus.AAC.14
MSEHIRKAGPLARIDVVALDRAIDGRPTHAALRRLQGLVDEMKGGRRRQNVASGGVLAVDASHEDHMHLGYSY